MDNMNEMVYAISTQAVEIFGHFGAVPHFKTWEEKSQSSGKTDIVELSIDWRMPMKTVTFKRIPPFKTIPDMENEIKSYLLDCVDRFILNPSDDD